MKEPSQFGLGLLAAVLLIVIVLGSILVSLVESSSAGAARPVGQPGWIEAASAEKLLVTAGAGDVLLMLPRPTSPVAAIFPTRAEFDRTAIFFSVRPAHRLGRLPGSAW